MSTNELLPCPFCGEPPMTMQSGEGGKGLMIQCMTEHCVCPHVSYYDHASAIRAWNRRTGYEIRPAEGWQPIESAPMDGTLVLLWSPGSVPDVGGMFDSGNKKWWTAHTVPVSPTHWLPLPAPPARGNGDG